MLWDRYRRNTFPRILPPPLTGVPTILRPSTRVPTPNLNTKLIKHSNAICLLYYMHYWNDLSKTYSLVANLFTVYTIPPQIRPECDLLKISNPLQESSRWSRTSDHRRLPWPSHLSISLSFSCSIVSVVAIVDEIEKLCYPYCLQRIIYTLIGISERADML